MVGLVFSDICQFFNFLLHSTRQTAQGTQVSQSLHPTQPLTGSALALSVGAHLPGHGMVSCHHAHEWDSKMIAHCSLEHCPPQAQN